MSDKNNTAKGINKKMIGGLIVIIAAIVIAILFFSGNSEVSKFRKEIARLNDSKPYITYTDISRDGIKVQSEAFNYQDDENFFSNTTHFNGDLEQGVVYKCEDGKGSSSSMYVEVKDQECSNLLTISKTSDYAYNTFIAELTSKDADKFFEVDGDKLVMNKEGREKMAKSLSEVDSKSVESVDSYIISYNGAKMSINMRISERNNTFDILSSFEETKEINYPDHIQYVGE